MNIYRERMGNVVRALKEGVESHFTMRIWGYACGTPACALGHYAHRRDLQQAFKLEYCLVTARSTDYGSVSRRAMDHFGITDIEYCTLFGSNGCGDAQTRDEAVAYIEEFIERKWPIEEPVPVMVGELERELETA